MKTRHAIWTVATAMLFPEMLVLLAGVGVGYALIQKGVK